MIAEQKQSLRAEARGLLAALSAVHKQAAGREILAILERWTPWLEARTVCAFSALPSEPDLLTPWPQDKKIILPRVAGDELCLHFVDSPAGLVAGSFGIFEPSASLPLAEERADLILVPGLAFDESGGRLGRGRGYYDRLLAGFHGLRVGVCFEELVFERIPAEEHDVTMDFLATPGGIISCGTQNTL